MKAQLDKALGLAWDVPSSSGPDLNSIQSSVPGRLSRWTASSVTLCAMRLVGRMEGKNVDENPRADEDVEKWAPANPPKIVEINCKYG